MEIGSRTSDKTIEKAPKEVSNILFGQLRIGSTDEFRLIISVSRLTNQLEKLQQQRRSTQALSRAAVKFLDHLNH